LGLKKGRMIKYNIIRNKTKTKKKKHTRKSRKGSFFEGMKFFD